MAHVRVMQEGKEILWISLQYGLIYYDINFHRQKDILKCMKGEEWQTYVQGFI